MHQRGDTIIEVILAVTIFSLVAIGGMSIMNQGTAAAQRSLEIGLVRAQMDAQVDALRYMHDAYVTSIGEGNSKAAEIWKKAAVNHKISAATPFEATSNGTRCQLPTDAYAIDVRKLDGGTHGTDDPTIAFEAAAFGPDEDVPVSSGSLSFPVTYAQIRYEDLSNPNSVSVAQGIWIQAVHKLGLNSGDLGYYDFNIRACWLTPGQSTPVTLGTVERLYDPVP